MKTLPRAAAGSLKRLLRTFPAVLVCGPRQCGKSTLVRSELPDWRLFDLESPEDHARVAGDLAAFLAANPKRVVVDEAQRLPDLFPALRHHLDRRKSKGSFVLTGSASPALLRNVSESLAGRIGILELTPFLASELPAGGRQDRWFWGGYPPVQALRGATARRAWFDGYVRTFLERDLPSLGFNLAPTRVRRLWTMLTHVHGSLLNLSDLGRSLGVSYHTVQSHLDVLEGAFMIRRLQPHYANIQKRLTKAPKAYIRDTGLLHFLAGLEEPGALETWNRLGQSFEGLVIEEILSQMANRVVDPYSAFWRTQAGAEVDLLVGAGTQLVPIEIKLARTVGHRDARGLEQCMSDLHIDRGFVVNTGDDLFELRPGVTVVPWRMVRDEQFDFGIGKAVRRRGSKGR